MSRRPPVSTRRALACVCVLVGLLSGCGRVGVRLVASRGASPDAAVSVTVDAGASQSSGPDAGMSSVDAGMDAAVSSSADASTDAGSDAATSSMPDAGAPDAGPPSCPGGCQNAHGTAECKNGSCMMTCAGLYADCDGSPANGCEADLSADPSHCGHCAQTCDANIERCVNSSCELSPCSPGRGECDNNPAVACETDLTSSAANCGFCGNACSAAHATSQCTASACAIASCNSNYDDCDGMYESGCEAALLTSLSDCGMCGNACAATGGGTAVCNAGTCESRCDLNGVFALRMSVPATWPSTSVLASGSGTFVLWAKLQLTQSGTSLSVQTTPCGETVPDFSATPVINEKYGVVYPTAIFDRVPPPASISGTGSVGSLKVGASFSLTKSAWLVGASMSDPLNGAWPSSSALTQVDADGDGNPAVTLNYKSGTGYSWPPTNNVGSTRANVVYLAGRAVFSLSGTLSTCSAWSGSASVQDLDSHSIGCRTTGGSTCSMSDYNYLDSNTPNYQPQPATFNIARLSNTATCATVRSMLP